MVKSKYKRLFIGVFGLLLLLLILSQFTFFQKAMARISTSIYVNNHYSEMGLQYQSVEFVPQFGDYSVRYIDKNGKTINFMVGPKFMPVLILFDPLNPSMSIDDDFTEQPSSKSSLQ